MFDGFPLPETAARGKHLPSRRLRVFCHVPNRGGRWKWMDVALTPHWFIRNGFQVFCLEYGSFTGSILQIGSALEYDPLEHVGVGLGLDSFGMSMKADDEDWPGVDLNGKVVFNYTGLQIYLRCFF